jgi:DNA replication licensing factor MCM5
MPDGTYRRGDINVLLLGDPSTAKSQFLKFTSKTAPIAVYTSGKGSSAAGLTASVIRDPASRDFYLEGGAMVLADGGVVCIDEFDKMRPEDRVAIHEAMEQQTISIAKAGITTMLRSRTSVLAAANPPSGRYDDLKSAQENIDLQSTILSRFDLIFIVKDERSVERDMMIARHVLDVHRLAGAQPEADEDEKREEAFLKRYIEFCRQQCSPRICDSAAKLLANEYVELRAESKRAASADGSDIPAIPVTVRQLEAVIRISESLAKMNLQTTATEAHVRQALELFKTSTMDAVKSGLMEVAVFTDEQRQEIHRVEEQIKRRVAIGSFVSERKLVDELVRVGFNENLVRKGLLFLQTTGDLEYRRERRLVHRMK